MSVDKSIGTLRTCITTRTEKSEKSLFVVVNLDVLARSQRAFKSEVVSAISWNAN